jgi:hypothetical protein
LVSSWAGESNTSDSLGINNGTSIGSVSYTTGKSGQAFSFNGSSAVKIANAPSLNPTGNFTIAAWIKTSSTGTGGPTIIGKYYGTSTSYKLRLNDNQSFGLVIGNSGTAKVLTTAANSYSLNVWTFVACTYNKTTGVAEIFVNGVSKGTLSSVASPDSSSIPLYIGAVGNDTNTGTFFTGGIDQISFFNTALSGSQISSLYNNP